MKKVEIIIRILVGIIPLISLFGLLFFYIDLMNILIDNGILQRKNIFHAIAILTLLFIFYGDLTNG